MQALADVRMARSQRPLADVQAAAEIRLGIDVTTLVVIKHGKTGKAPAKLQVIGTECLLLRHERFFEDLLGVNVATLNAIERGESVLSFRHLQMIRSQRL